MHALGISLASFRIAGGIMLFMIALDMVFERRTQRRESRAQSIEGTPEAEDISVFPMAIPMIAGPGSIASAMLWVSRADDPGEVAVVLAAITAVVLLTLLALLAAGPLMRLIGPKIEAMITRLLGVILAALAAQFIVDGLKESVPGHPRLRVSARPATCGTASLAGSTTGVSHAGTFPLLQLRVEAARRLGHENRRRRAVRAGQQIIGAILADDRPRLPAEPRNAFITSAICSPLR